MSGGSNSKTSSATTYSAEDRRVVADNQSAAFSGDVATSGGLVLSGDKSRLGMNFSSSDASRSAGLGLIEGQRNTYTDSRAWSFSDSSDHSNTDNSVYNILDGGAIKESADVVRSALRTVEAGDATNGEGFSKLLDFAGRLFDGAGDAIGRQQELAGQATAGAMSTAAELKTGSIDNKTIVIMAVAGAAAVAAWGINRK